MPPLPGKVSYGRENAALVYVIVERGDKWRLFRWIFDLRGMAESVCAGAIIAFSDVGGQRLEVRKGRSSYYSKHADALAEVPPGLFQYVEQDEEGRTVYTYA